MILKGLPFLGIFLTQYLDTKRIKESKSIIETLEKFGENEWQALENDINHTLS